MRKFICFALIIAAACFCSCNKNHNPNQTPNDTLTAGWTKLSGAPAGGNFLDIFFINNTGFVMAPRSIYKSSDGGTNWTPVFSSSYSLWNLGMGSEQNAAFIGAGNKFFTTHNSAASFDTIPVNENNVTDVFFINNNTAYAVGHSFWKTTNGSSSWVKLYDFPSGSAYNSLYFLDSLNGWVTRENGLFKTTDGGVTWQNVPIGPGHDLSGSSIFFVTSNRGFFADATSISSTTDGGASWNRVYTGSFAFHDIHFVSDSVGYITDGPRILKTTNGGSTWNKVVALAGNDPIFELHFTDAHHGWACGIKGIFKYQQ